MNVSESDKQKQITHVLYSQDDGVQDRISCYVQYKKGDFFHYLNVPDDAIQNLKDIDLRPYIKNSMSHGIIRADEENILHDLRSEIEKLFTDVEVTVDMKRQNWYHLKFNNLEQSVNAVGTSISVGDKEYKIEKWRPKAKKNELMGYLKHLLWDNYSHDTYLQNLASKHKNWIPISNTSDNRKEGIITFKWIVNKRVRAARIRECVEELGGRVSNNGRFVTTPVIQNYTHTQN